MKSSSENVAGSVEGKDADGIGSLSWVLKIFGLMTLASALFGVGYQKGVILAMGLGNLSGNYEVREIFNSAVLGYIHLMSKLGIDSYWKGLASVLNRILFHSPALIFIVMLSLALVTLYRNNNQVKEVAVKVKKSSLVLFNKVWVKFSLMVLGLASSITAILVTLITLTHLIPMFVVILLLPTLFGYMAGSDYIKEGMDRDVCSVVTTEMIKDKYIRQCTQILINGKKIMGEIVLENTKGYYIHRNNSFVYAAKDGKSCFYSIFEKTEIVKSTKNFTFKDEELSSFCGAGVVSEANIIQAK
ncbi:hypothetical protein HWQ46_22035 [Shewanella sp. D64]|uniref:hypothetical protein n=1 Tax=unclassified Shewanella TaxID=196818 RepID=UPI0022BA708E|nr:MULTISPECIES: hypothetical protein [unclassified Shewanella]MEC4728220.1 hypothetical protein [Shewanella sp. D64]MEC4740017.1 hypothetical protein [Shewanella sp. E94]WBJ94373.1 hypothetical protein HWQ47_21270 [Shewanella sp. MTB7]